MVILCWVGSTDLVSGLGSSDLSMYAPSGPKVVCEGIGFFGKAILMGRQPVLL